MEDYLHYAYSAVIGRVRSRPRRPVRRILVTRLDHIGDLLMTTPVLSALRGHFPDAEITLVIGEWNLPVIENNPNIDRVIVHNSSRFARPPYPTHEHEHLTRQLAGYKPDLVLGLRDDWATLNDALRRNAWFLERGTPHVRFWLERKLHGGDEQHETERLAEVVRPLGIELGRAEKLQMYLTSEERAAAREFIARRGIRPPFAVLQPAATNPLRQWYPDRYAEVARRLAEHQGMQIILAGAPSETAQAAEVAALITDLDPVDISGDLGLRAFAAFLEHAALYIGSDGGAMHLAAAMGTRTIGLFGPGPYHGFYPVGKNATAISHLFPCAPCRQTGCIRPEDNCMMAITVEEVLGRAEGGGRREEGKDEV